MSAEYLENLEDNAYRAIRALESERFYEYSEGLVELVRQCKHYQQLTESLLAAHTGVPRDENEANLKKAREHRTWYRYQETTTEVAIYEGS